VFSHPLTHSTHLSPLTIHDSPAPFTPPASNSSDSAPSRRIRAQLYHGCQGVPRLGQSQLSHLEVRQSLADVHAHFFLRFRYRKSPQPATTLHLVLSSLCAPESLFFALFPRRKGSWFTMSTASRSLKQMPCFDCLILADTASADTFLKAVCCFSPFPRAPFPSPRDESSWLHQPA
jgi:hypothetical protein